MTTVNHHRASPPSDQENISPSRPPRPVSRVLSGTELTPLKLVMDHHRQNDRPRSVASSTVSSVPEEDGRSAEEKTEGGAPQQQQQQQQPSQPQQPPAPGMPTRTNSVRSPRKMLSPEKRFPIKINPSINSAMASGGAGVSTNNGVPTPPPSEPSTTTSSRPSSLTAAPRQMSLDDVIRSNEEVRNAIRIFEDGDDSDIDSRSERGGGEPGAEDATATVTINAADAYRHGVPGRDRPDDDGPAGPDDTMVSTFSTFSAVPNMTMLARFGGGGSGVGQTPLRRAQTTALDGNTTNLLLDFAADPLHASRYGHYQQQNGQPPSPTSRARGAASGRVSPTRMDAVGATPSRPTAAASNLLDFDIPPMPTPRSIPSITPRELESLKSSYLSEISSLRASLSGKEAEVQSLKQSLGDAERRAGAGMEQLRSERAARSALEAERDEWQRRGREMEAVLRRVKEEIVAGQRERDELECRLAESEHRREAAEQMAQEAESRLAGLRAGKAAAEERERQRLSGDGSGAKGGAANSSKEVELAVERVARELHALYKSKHETKVAALKKSYEARWEKRVREAEARAEALARENDELRIGRDATMTKVDPVAEEKKAQQAAQDAARLKELEAEGERLRAELESVANEGRELRRLLEQERIEKGELVLVAEELMQMQQMQQSVMGGRPPAAPPTPQAAPTQSPPRAAPTPQRTLSKREPGEGGTNRRSSMLLATPKTNGATSSSGGAQHAAKRVSAGKGVPGASGVTGIRPPIGSGESRIGRGIPQPSSAHERGRSVNGGLPRPGSGLGLRSGGILSSIEKMGSYNRG